jgi:hypothetical protein
MRYSKTTNQFYSETLRYNPLPTDLIAITADEHTTALAVLNAGGSLDVLNGKLICTPITTAAANTAALAIAVARKATAIDTLAQQYITEQVGSTPDFEKSIWASQLAEAVAYTTDPKSATPTLSAIATARNTSVDWLAAKVIAKSNSYTALVASVVGQRQDYQLQLTAATTPANVDAIAITYTNPIAAQVVTVTPPATTGKGKKAQPNA